MLPSLIPGTSLLYSSKDIIQNATVDLHALSRTLRRIQSHRGSNSTKIHKDNALRSKIHEKDEYMEGMEKDILRNVQVVSKSIKKSLSTEWTSSLLEMEDNVKYDTKRMHRILLSIQTQIKNMDQEISELTVSDKNFDKFSSEQQQQLLKLSSLESQLSVVNKKFSTIKSEVRQLKVDLNDMSQTNQILRHRLHAKSANQVELREKICSLFSEINRIGIEEKQAYVTLSNLITSSEKLEMLCQQEWRHIMVLVAEKSALEDSVRRFRSGDQINQKRGKRKHMAVVVSEAVHASELDRICRIWAQCTWSNAIDSIKIESANSWLKQREREWKLVLSEIGMDMDMGIDELCQWFVDHEEQNIAQFEEVRKLALQRKQISDEAASVAKYYDGQDIENEKTSSAIVFRLLRNIEDQKHELAMLEDERKQIYMLMEEIRHCLFKMFAPDEPLADTDLAGSLSYSLTLLDLWTKEALAEVYGSSSTSRYVECDQLQLQIEPPDIRNSLSDEDDDPI